MSPCAQPLRADDEGFSIVEVLVATTILMVVVIAITTALTSSLTSAVLTRQREGAASLASASIENAKAIGMTGLSSSPATPGTCTAFTGAQTSSQYGTCRYVVTMDGTTFNVLPTVTGGTPARVTVTVTWGTRTYITSSDVGPQTTAGATTS